ncbi:Poly(3-hydroxybutyrate) depolymerase OS=Castellaniella defragrans OX=75697 GN=HNR28_002438 PE=4 SV=1 [Castellaniella defragrans]
MYLSTDMYALHEMRREWLSAWAVLAGAGAQAFSNPFSPLAHTPFSRLMTSSFELAWRLGKDYEKPAWNLDHARVGGRNVTVREEIVLRQPFCNLVHFQRVGVKGDPRVLLVAPLSGHHATLLRNTVAELLPSHDVYVTEWADARMVPEYYGAFSLTDYVHYVQTFLRELGAGLHLIAVCQPAVPVLAAVALKASAGESQQPRTLTLMGGPIDARKSPTQVDCLATTKPFEWFKENLICRVPDRYPGAGRLVYPGFLQYAGFVAMNPARHFKSHYDFFLHLVEGDESDAETHRRFYDEYNAVLDMPANYYLDCIRIVFQEFRLAQGTWEIDGHQVEPAAIRKTALLTIEGERDDISGQGQTHAAQDLCSGLAPGMKERMTVKNCGHYGIFAGSQWRTKICPRVAAFIRGHEPQVASGASA